MASPKHFYLCDEKGDLQQSFKHFLYKYLSKYDTCQLESAQEKNTCTLLKYQQQQQQKPQRCWFGKQT